MAADDNAGACEDRLALLEADRQHDMAIVNGKIRLKASRLALGAGIWVVAAFGLVGAGVLDLSTATHITSGLVVGGAVYLSPTLDTRRRIKRYYELERGEAEQSAERERL